MTSHWIRRLVLRQVSPSSLKEQSHVVPSFAHRGIILIEGFTVVEDKANVWTELFSWFVSGKISTDVSTNNSDLNFFTTVCVVIIRQEYATINFYSYSFLRVSTNFKFNILFAQMFRQQFETTFFAWEFPWKICLRVWGTAQILNREYIYNWTEVEKVISRYENFLQEYILCDLCFKWTFLQGKTAVLSKL